MLQHWGRITVAHARWIVLAALVLTVVAATYGSGVFEVLSRGGFSTPDSQSLRELTLEHVLLGNHGDDVIALYSSPTLMATDPAFAESVKQVIASLPEAQVASVRSYYGSGDARLLSTDRHATQVRISLAGTSQDALADAFDAIKDNLQAQGLHTAIGGNWAVFSDIDDIVSRDLRRAEAYSLPIVLALGVLIFGSLTAAIMPVLVGAVAVVGALALLRLLTLFTDVSIFAVNIITLLGMGLAIDYALFIISRFREELNQLPATTPDAAGIAIRRTLDSAGRTVVFSGLTVAAALASLLIFTQTFLKSMGYGGVAAVLVAMLTALTVLPALLRLLGRRIDSGRVPRRFTPWRGITTGGVTRGRWYRVAEHVMRRPLLYALAITLALLALGAPFVGVQWGGVGGWVLPADAPSQRAAARIQTDFGGAHTSANLLLLNADRSQLLGYSIAVRAVPGVTDLRTVAHNEQATLLRVSWQGKPQTAHSRTIVAAIRNIEPRREATALVGGATAITIDLLDSLAARLPWMAATVLAIMLVLLFLAFGSLVLPVKAVLMNAISISASFGVVTWIFADGHLEGLLGFQSPGFLEATEPILMLAILFGLSMDYEVFLLSRIREAWDAGADNTHAVATGLQHTGGIITSAALLLAVVIGAFGTSQIVFMKMIGIGMLVALLLDASVVRILLVPAAMKLLGRANWWAPEPMARWWRMNGPH